MLSLEQMKSVAVIGSGVMGPGIALCYSRGGYEARLTDLSETALETAKKTIESQLETMVEVGEIEAAEKDPIFGRISYFKDMKEAVEGVQLVVEVIIENSDRKKGLYEQLDKLLPEETIIASNTSMMNIFEIMPARRQPYSVITHWFDPPHIMPLVEVVKGPETLEEVMVITVEMLDKSKKIAPRMEKYRRGFFVNLAQQGLTDIAFSVVKEGYCTPEQFDIAIKSSVYPRGVVLGVFQKSDFSSNPTVDGIFGVRVGKGYYDYEYKDRDLDELFKERDRRLWEVVNIARKNIYDKL